METRKSQTHKFISSKEGYSTWFPPRMLGKGVVYNLVILLYLQGQTSPGYPKILFGYPRPISSLVLGIVSQSIKSILMGVITCALQQLV